MDTETVVTTYGAAWAEPDEERRRALLEQAWADDAVYEDPTARVEGRDAFIAHIGGFQTAMAGHVIELTSGVDTYGSVLRFAWVMRNAAGEDVVEGVDFGELAPDGRLARIQGFFGPWPTLPT